MRVSERGRRCPVRADRVHAESGVGREARSGLAALVHSHVGAAQRMMTRLAFPLRSRPAAETPFPLLPLLLAPSRRWRRRRAAKEPPPRVSRLYGSARLQERPRSCSRDLHPPP